MLVWWKNDKHKKSRQKTDNIRQKRPRELEHYLKKQTQQEKDHKENRFKKFNPGEKQDV
jgi:hypothetical protein